MHTQSIEDGLTSVTELPYFEGDFWPNVIEEQIKELDQEERAQASGEVSTYFILKSIVQYSLTDQLYGLVSRPCVLLLG